MKISQAPPHTPKVFHKAATQTKLHFISSVEL